MTPQRRPSRALTSALSTRYPRKSLHPHNGSTPDNPPHTTRPATTQVGLHEDEKPSERYRAKKTLHTDTLVMMECKLWLCKILSLLCTVRLDIRLSKLLARYAMGRVSDGQQAGHGPRLFLSPRSSSLYTGTASNGTVATGRRRRRRRRSSAPGCSNLAPAWAEACRERSCLRAAATAPAVNTSASTTNPPPHPARRPPARRRRGSSCLGWSPAFR